MEPFSVDKSVEKMRHLPLEQAPPVDLPLWQPFHPGDLQPGKIYRVKRRDAATPEQVRWLYVVGDKDGQVLVLVSWSYEDVQRGIRLLAMDEAGWMTPMTEAGAAKYELYMGDR